ncbi:MAG: host-nuclease inhibitor Gam family protein [bacterium]
MVKKSTKTVKVKADSVLIPKDMNEVTRFIAKISVAQREIDERKGQLEDQLERARTQAAAYVNFREEKIAQFFQGIFIFAHGHWEELTEDGKKKTINTPTGDFGWRTNPPSVSLKDVEVIKKYLEVNGLNKFLRPKVDVDKEAMLKDQEEAEKIPGVTFKQEEMFFVKPAEVSVEMESPEAKLRKATKKKKLN